MAIWVIADLHLSFGTPNKEMDIFGPRWALHTKRLEEHWKNSIAPDDLVLLPGDISWAKHLEQAMPDLEWIHQLPGTKVMIRGNHDYWWSSVKKVRAALPSSLHIIQHDSFHWEGYTIVGSRLWDTPEFSYNRLIEFVEGPQVSKLPDGNSEQDEKIFERELHRLELSLDQMDPEAHTRIAMTHYPPIGPEQKPSRASELLAKYQIDVCVFGHLHNITPGTCPSFTASGVRYYLTACDYLNCTPLKIFS